MKQAVIYPNGEGGVAIFSPDTRMLAKYGLDRIARKVVPAGLPFKIVDETELPQDKTTRNAWTVDEADLTDGVGNTSNELE